MANTRRNSIIQLLIVTAFVFAFAARIQCAVSSASPAEKVLKIGDSVILEGVNITRVAIADPNTADVAALSTKEILLNAKAVGRTMLYIWDASGRREYRVWVRNPQPDMAKICARISDQLNDPRIKVKAVGGVVVLDGTVSREVDSTRAESIAKLIVDSPDLPEFRSADIAASDGPSGEAKTLMVADKNADPASDPASNSGVPKPKITNLILIQKPFDEVSNHTMETALALRQALDGSSHKVRALPGGIVVIEGKVGTQKEFDALAQFLKAWDGRSVTEKGTVNQVSDTFEKITVVNAVQLDASVAQQIMVRAQIVDIDRNAMKDFGVDWGRVTFNTGSGGTTTQVEDQPWLIGQTGTGPFDLFGGGTFKRFDPIGARIKALEQQSKAKVLSEPNLLVLDGREASILVGGEIPVPVVQSSQTGQAASVSVIFKEFGVRMMIQPNITGDNTIQLRIAPEVSALDYTNAVSFSGFVIPALKTRRAETIVDVKDGQSLIIGGLIQNTNSKLIKQIPVLGNLPILGELFKTRSFQNQQSELVIIVTPQIVRPMAQTAAAK
ncbi:MAG TPA: pilus assembly protein N-terminal domain-containing protein [Armatimonadota bacterium]|jgi:Flp pilus assembly secretin CpaC